MEQQIVKVKNKKGVRVKFLQHRLHRPHHKRDSHKYHGNGNANAGICNGNAYLIKSRADPSLVGIEKGK